MVGHHLLVTSREAKQCDCRCMGICQSESHRAPPLATLQLATDGTYQKGYFRQPAGLVWHNRKIRVVALKFLFKSTTLWDGMGWGGLRAMDHRPPLGNILWPSTIRLRTETSHQERLFQRINPSTVTYAQAGAHRLERPLQYLQYSS